MVKPCPWTPAWPWPLNFEPVIIESSDPHGVRRRVARSTNQYVPREKPVLAPYLHLPMNEAAMELRMSFSELKREYRKQGFHSWPGREIRAINREMAQLEGKLPTANLWRFIETKTRIKALQEKKMKIYEKVNSGQPDAASTPDITPQSLQEASTSK